MRLSRFLPLLALGAVVTASSCEDPDDDHNHVTIELLEPGDGSTVSDASDVHVHVRFTAEEENHEVTVVLHPEGDESDLLIDVSQHAHDAEVNIEQDLDLSSYPSGTEFHLEAEGCEDHDCGEVATADFHFSIP